jgi:hypothetical protein
MRLTSRFKTASNLDERSEYKILKVIYEGAHYILEFLEKKKNSLVFSSFIIEINSASSGATKLLWSESNNVTFNSDRCHR